MMPPIEPEPPPQSFVPAASFDASSAGDAWCAVLEKFGLDLEQAEALTRATTERAATWSDRMNEVFPAARLYDVLVDRPTHPEALRQGLELYRRRMSRDDA
jgi:hypothetical protein